MATDIIETSFDTGSVDISSTFVSTLLIKAKKNGREVSYDGKNLASVETIDEDVYRSGGRAVVGAIVGGVLTGGIGLLAGAAFGGRRRVLGCYLLTLDNGEHIAFRENRKKVVKILNEHSARLRIAAMTKAR